MKLREMESILTKMGYWISRANKHTIWTNGITSIVLPRHKTIGRPMAKSVLKDINYSDSVCEVHYYPNKLIA